MLTIAVSLTAPSLANFFRGRPLDYDLWESRGAAGWGWDDVRPYFLRAENNERGASENHATGGPLNVCDERSPRPLTGRFLAAAERAGIPRVPDYNGPEQDGFGFVRYVIDPTGALLVHMRRFRDEQLAAVPFPDLCD